LRATPGNRRFEHLVNHVQQRDFTALVTHFDSLWRGLFEQGIIRPRAELANDKCWRSYSCMAKLQVSRQRAIYR
jgi:hypothetical protein